MGGVVTRPSDTNRFYTLSKADCPIQDFKRCIYHSDMSDSVYKGEISDDEFFDYIKNVSGSPLPVSELIRLYIECKGGIYEQTISEISRLKENGHSIYLLSNLKEVDFEHLSSIIDVGKYFDGLFLSYKLGMCKPNQDIYRHVIDTLGTNDFCFVDDSDQNVEAAINLGITAYKTDGDNIVKCLSKFHR